MAFHHVLSYIRRLWSQICGQTTCQPSSYGTLKIPQHHIRLEWVKYAGIDLTWD